MCSSVYSEHIRFLITSQKYHIGQQISNASFIKMFCHLLCKYLWNTNCLLGNVSWSHYTLIIQSLTSSHKGGVQAGGDTKMSLFWNKETATFSSWSNLVFSQARAWNYVIYLGLWFVIHYLYRAHNEIKQAHTGKVQNFGLNPRASLCCFSLQTHSSVWFTG